MSKLSIALSTPNLDTCSLTIENYTADTVSLKYDTLNGNQPSTYSNCVKIWESSSIPWTAEPIKTQLVTQNSQTGTLAGSAHLNRGVNCFVDPWKGQSFLGRGLRKWS